MIWFMNLERVRDLMSFRSNPKRHWSRICFSLGFKMLMGSPKERVEWTWYSVLLWSTFSLKKGS